MLAHKKNDNCQPILQAILDQNPKSPVFFSAKKHAENKKQPLCTTHT